MLNLPFDSRKVLAGRSGQKVLEGGYLGFRRVYGAIQLLDAYLPAMLDRVEQIIKQENWDIVISAGMPVGTERIVRRAGVNVFRIYWAPHWPSDENPSIYLSSKDWGSPTANRASHLLVQWASRAILPRNLKEKIRRAGEPSTIIDDSFFLSIPSWFALPDFLCNATIRKARHARSIGFIRPSRFAGCADSFSKALEYKEKNRDYPFIYCGFGSLKSSTTDFQLSLLVAAARRLGIKLWLPKNTVGKLNRECQDSTHVYPLDTAPHRQLFPLVDGVVCHGGIGTLVSALDSGRSVAIVPHWFDQFHWADKLSRLNLAITANGLGSEKEARRLLAATLDFRPNEKLVHECQRSCGLDDIDNLLLEDHHVT